MRKLYVMILLIAILASVSAVSASDNLTLLDNQMSADDSDIGLAEVGEDSGEVQLSDNVHDENIASSSDLNQSTADTPNKVNQVPHKVKTKNVKTTYGTPVKYTLKLVDKSGDIIVGKQVKFKVNNKVYKIKTDQKGIATLKLKLNAGKYTIKYSVGGLTGKNTCTVYNKVTMTILKWGNKGDVSKVNLIKKNMPNNKWVKKAVAVTKKGNPLLKFQGGNGKTVFITSGVHGNELSSQVAVMKLIKHLSKTPIKGTVYIIPFVNLKAISHKVRHTGVDYNRVAHKSGTISNKIVKLVVKYDADAYGDFHTTQPGGAPGKNIVMGSKTPAGKCKSMTNYIAKHAKVNKRIYKYAGEQYPGALADNVNKKGIPGVICEVVLPHNTVTANSVKISYNMMNSLLKFNSIV